MIPVPAMAHPMMLFRGRRVRVGGTTVVPVHAMMIICLGSVVTTRGLSVAMVAPVLIGGCWRGRLPHRCVTGSFARWVDVVPRRGEGAAAPSVIRRRMIMVRLVCHRVRRHRLRRRPAVMVAAYTPAKPDPGCGPVNWRRTGQRLADLVGAVNLYPGARVRNLLPEPVRSS